MSLLARSHHVPQVAKRSLQSAAFPAGNMCLIVEILGKDNRLAAATLTLEEFIRHDSPHHLQDNDIAPKEFQGTCEGKLGSCGSEGEFCLYIFDVSQCRQPSLVAQMLKS